VVDWFLDKSISAENLLLNPGFEADFTSWVVEELVAVFAGVAVLESMGILTAEGLTLKAAHLTTASMLTATAMRVLFPSASLASMSVLTVAGTIDGGAVFVFGMATQGMAVMEMSKNG
jgi:hypothetical protein